MTPIKNESNPSLCVSDLKQLQDAVKAAGMPAFRAKQLHEWVYGKWELDPERMLNLPKEFRRKLTELFNCCSSNVEKISGSPDGTEKLLLRLQDNEAVEMVIIRAPERITFCLSTQVGCPVRCRFCASGADGLVRNLETYEIIEQIFHGVHKAGRKPDNLVFMGIGEGLLNFNNLRDALLLLTEEYGFAQRRITVSTSGYVPGIYKLAELDRQFELAVSLHAPDDAMRAKLIPDAVRYSVAEILKATDHYRDKTGRIPTFEYTLIERINDSVDAATELAVLAKKHRAEINLIPYNETPDNNFRRPSQNTIKSFVGVLVKKGVPVTCRIEKGSAADAACGQLRASHKK